MPTPSKGKHFKKKKKKKALSNFCLDKFNIGFCTLRNESFVFKASKKLLGNKQVNWLILQFKKT